MAATTSDEEPSADISRKRKHSSLAIASEECPEKKKKADEPLETRVSCPKPRDKFFQCRYPDCGYQWPMKRNWNPKRHYRARHFPWFASVHLRSRNLDAFPGLAELWMEFATVSVPEASSFRSVTQTSVGLRIQIDDSQSKVCISPMQHVSGMIIDSHFHYDRIDEMFNHVPGKLKILGAIHKVRAHGGEGEGGESRPVRTHYVHGGREWGGVRLLHTVRTHFFKYSLKVFLF